MADPHRLELLHRTRDLLDSVLAQYAEYLAIPRPVMTDFENALDRLTASGFDVSDFRPGSNAVDRNGDGDKWILTPRMTGARGFVSREIEREERVARAADERVASDQAAHSPEPNSVFVVHGQDTDARETVFTLLREVQLVPRGFEEARKLTGRPLPYIGEVLDAAFQYAQAVVVLFTPDERVELSGRLHKPNQPIHVEHQPRPNVLIEAGIALTTHPDRTIIVELGNVRSISDLSGRHVVRWTEDTPAGRDELIDRLGECGCHPKRDGARWMEVGKKDRPTWS